MGSYIALWVAMYFTVSFSWPLTLGLAALAALFLVRIFIIFHDCGHGSYFKSKKANNTVGFIAGLMTLTPYRHWRWQHAVHHGTSGNLDERGIGDVCTLTVAEYKALKPVKRLRYRFYRHPIVLFGLGPGYLFFLKNRLPLGLMAKARYWVSAMCTNAAILAGLALIVYFGGVMPVVLIFLPSTLLAATAGVWLFYVQHQFETTHWQDADDWNLHDAALHGSSHYVMPGVLQWLSANIGIHHVHHLYSRIPFYRLPEVLSDHAVLAQSNRMTIRDSIANARLHLWDEKSKRLLSFAQASKIT